MRLFEACAACLGPDGSAAQVTRALRMIRGRWKLPILFRLYERTDFGSKRPHVEYRITEAGRRLLRALIAVREFGASTVPSD